MAEKKVCIIIPFIGINDYVLECIEGCLNLNYSNYEIILLPEHKINLPLKYVKKNVKVVETDNVTIAKSRNIGINLCKKADFYAFIDSDAYPIRDWLKEAVKAFEINPDIWGVGGPNITPPKEGILRRVVGNSQKSFLVSGMRSYRKKIAKSRFCCDMSSCNLIINKKAMNYLKGFNENLITGEDGELCNRIIKNNKKIFYSKKVIVYHHNRTLFKPYTLQKITFGLSVFKVMKESPSISNLYMFFPFLFFLSLIIIPFLAIINICMLFLWGIIVSFYFITIFIETLRYSKQKLEIPFTFVAIVIGNLAPGIGSLLAFIKFPVNIKKVYRNFE
ncbi:MAG: glycosyltransferase [Candidatus Aenigmarchaeota archaeon]|nr:glycosyltransferase [Candidatus Aenigmarchaeota archaeon]